MPKRGPKCKLGSYRVFHLIVWVLYTGMQGKCLSVPHDPEGKLAIHDTTVYRVFATWADDGSLWQAFIASVRHLATEKHLETSLLHGDGTNTVAKKGGMAFGYAGQKHPKGAKVIAIIDHHGYVLAPVPVAPGNETDMVLLPQGLKALKQVAKQVGLDLRDASRNLDGGCDAAHHRQCMFNAGLIPNIKENPRNRKPPKRGRTRFFNEAIYALRMRVERTLA